jgi:chromosome segregation ATPase
MRTDLTNAQNARIALESRLASLTSELSALRVHSHAQSRQINQLEQAKEQLERRAKDQTDELQGKGKFVIGVQDEMVALELQLNMAEQKVDRLQKDNDELTKRWMAKIEQEANEMNKSPFTR